MAKDDPTTGGLTVHVRMTADELEALDAEVARQEAAAPAGNVTRASVLRHLVRQLPRPRAAKPRKPAKRGA